MLPNVGCTVCYKTCCDLQICLSKLQFGSTRVHAIAHTRGRLPRTSEKGTIVLSSLGTARILDVIIASVTLAIS